MASTFCIYDSSLFFAGVWIRNHVFLSKCLEQQFFFLKRFEANQNLAKSPNASTITLRLRPNRRTSHNWKPELCCSSCYLSMSAFDERSPGGLDCSLEHRPRHGKLFIKGEENVTATTTGFFASSGTKAFITLFVIEAYGLIQRLDYRLLSEAKGCNFVTITYDLVQQSKGKPFPRGQGFVHHPDVVGGFIENVAPSLEDLAGLRSREDG